MIAIVNMHIGYAVPFRARALLENEQLLVFTSSYRRYKSNEVLSKPQ